MARADEIVRSIAFAATRVAHRARAHDVERIDAERARVVGVARRHASVRSMACGSERLAPYRPPRRAA